MSERRERRTGDDPPRLLHARSELGYTEVGALALPDEPEAVDRDTQQRQTQRAYLAARERRIESWRATSALIDLALARFATPTVLRDAPGLDGALAGVRDRLRKVDRQLGLR